MNNIAYTCSNILKSTKTVAQKEQLALEIDQLIASLFRQETNAFDNALKSIRLEVSQIIIDEFLNKESQSVNKEMVKYFLTELKKRLQKLRIIKLSLAFSPSNYSIDRIYDWIAKNVGDEYILDIQVDKSILGGITISFEGKYIDLSLKKRLDEVFKNKRQEIISSLSKT
ncbi:MAG: F0F1 ATP synthase subunit delta [Patescibacteria group bacterium]|mgnify:CR=1 FL=1